MFSINTYVMQIYIFSCIRYNEDFCESRKYPIRFSETMQFPFIHIVIKLNICVRWKSIFFRSYHGRTSYIVIIIYYPANANQHHPTPSACRVWMRLERVAANRIIGAIYRFIGQNAFQMPYDRTTNTQIPNHHHHHYQQQTHKHVQCHRRATTIEYIICMCVEHVPPVHVSAVEHPS